MSKNDKNDKNNNNNNKNPKTMERKNNEKTQCRRDAALWEVRRYEAAKEMMSKNVLPEAMRMLEDGYSPFGDDGDFADFAKKCAKAAVSYADALLSELGKDAGK